MNELLTRSLAQPEPEESADDPGMEPMEPGMVEGEESEQPAGKDEEW